ncbi:MAG: hypothetical protein JWN63_3474 [Candidatus Acidoferrum typicum]|jgi:hypothetical protein|nr:hypothetical protein [Candidatus Acidoferrum typicum]
MHTHKRGRYRFGHIWFGHISGYFSFPQAPCRALWGGFGQRARVCHRGTCREPGCRDFFGPQAQSRETNAGELAVTVMNPLRLPWIREGRVEERQRWL